MPAHDFASLTGIAIGFELLAAVLLLAAPLAAARLVRRRPDVPEPRLLLLAGAFVGVVGFGFFVDALGVLLPDGGASRWLRLATILTAVAALWLAVPAARRLLSLPSRKALERANQNLTLQIDRVQQANAQVSRSESRHRQLVETASEGILMLDRLGRLTFANARLAEMLGAELDGLAGRSILEFLPPDDRAGMIDSLARHRRGSGERGLGRLMRVDGHVLPVQFSSSPIREHGEVSGILSVVTDLSEETRAREALQALASDLEARVAQRTDSYRQVAATLQQTLERARHQSHTYGLLQTMSEMLQSCHSPLEGARVAAEFAQSLFDADAGTIYLAEEAEHGDRPVFRQLFAWGPPTESDETMKPEDCWSLRKGKPYPLTPQEHALRCPHLRLGPDRHALCLPLQAQARVVGAINLRAERPFAPGIVEAPSGDAAAADRREHTLKLAHLFASTTAQFLASLRLRQRLEEQSLRDPLTNLFNRRYFNEHLGIEFQRALRAKSPLALLMIDIDHFKRINDRFGHETGDRVLKAVAEVVAANARAGDIVCRWGGEEFLILMPGSNGQAARRRGDEIRSKVRDRVEVVGGTKVSVSIGVAAYPEHACDPDGLIEVSDRALYAAKGAGRNRVTVAVAGI